MSTVPHDGDPSASSVALLGAVQGGKRRQVTAACENCRRAKDKCDGRRPCSRCTRRKMQCQYAGGESETHGQALKRKYDDLKSLYELIKTADEGEAREKFRQIRAGEQVEMILRGAQHSDQEQDGNAARRRRKFLSTLIQTTAPLSHLVHLASEILLSPQLVANLPELVEYEPLRDTVISIETLAGVLTRSNPNLSLLSLGRNLTPVRIADGFSGSPPYWVNAAPWATNVSDFAASHLISTFLAMVNGYWRFLEQDVFIKAMRSGRPSEYCSSFLVNAILACASLFSEIDEAFEQSGQLLTRGGHFHREALRLWRLDTEQPLISTVQGLFVLSMGCSIRGKDKIGLELKNSAIVMHKRLSSSIHASRAPQEEVNAARVRSCLAWTVVWMDFSYALGLLSTSESITSSLDDAPYDLEVTLPDTVVYWSSYPLTQEPLPIRMNALLQQRCRLNVLIAKLMQLLFSKDLLEDRLVDDVKSLDQALMNWRTSLPPDLSYTVKMPFPLFEFHAQYLSVQMTLHNRALEVIQEPESAEAGDREAAELNGFLAALRRDNLMFAHQTAQFLKDFRINYGYKTTPTAVMHAAAVATSILLRSMQDAQTRAGPVSHPSRLREVVSADSLEDIHSSFEECFQCLLSMGMQALLPRAIARNIYNWAVQLKINLPPNVVQMLKIVSESAWKPTDLHELNSMYPNWILPSYRGNDKIVEQIPEWLEKWERMAADDQDLAARGARD